MSEDLTPASFKGAAFYVLSNEESGGRRGPLHLYPGRDEAAFEDLGAKAETFTVDGYLAGPGASEKLRALEEALAKPGAGELVLPWGQRLTAVLVEWRKKYAVKERGKITLSLVFKRAGQVLRPSVIRDTQSAAIAAADTARQVAEDRFADRVKITNQPDLVADDLAADTRALLRRFSFVASSVAGVILGGKSVMSLVRNPALMATAVSLGSQAAGAALAAVSGSQASPQMLSAISTATKAIPSTVNSVASGNRFELGFLEASSLAFSASKLAVNNLPMSADEAIVLRDGLNRSLDSLALLGSDEDFVAIRSLQAALSTDLTSRAAQLPRRVALDLPTGGNLLTSAQLVYGDDPRGLLARLEEMEARNPSRHSGLIPANQSLEVLTRG